MFEGEYKNGKMWNGNAKKCFYDNFEFEGNFSNGLKTGKGKEIDEKGML